MDNEYKKSWSFKCFRYPKKVNHWVWKEKAEVGILVNCVCFVSAFMYLFKVSCQAGDIAH